jgi:hypothetical protein
MEDVKLASVAELKATVQFPPGIKLINVGGKLIFVKYWLGSWRQISPDKQLALKKEFGIT